MKCLCLVARTLYVTSKCRNAVKEQKVGSARYKFVSKCAKFWEIIFGFSLLQSFVNRQIAKHDELWYQNLIPFIIFITVVIQQIILIAYVSCRLLLLMLSLFDQKVLINNIKKSIINKHYSYIFMYTCFIILLSQKLSISACTFHTVTFYKLFVLFGLRLAFLFFFFSFQNSLRQDSRLQRRLKLKLRKKHSLLKRSSLVHN